MTSLTQLRAVMAKSQYFALARKDTVALSSHSSVLPKISIQGNLISGATARVGIGFILNPISVLKARFEVHIFYITPVPDIDCHLNRATYMPMRASQAHLSPSFV
jgi:hypothetical protein